MHQFCDEILQLVLYELDDPTPFTLVSRRLYALSCDPYVRASYFLERYGPQQALFWALGRGKLLSPKVIDILLSSGAHLSRYLAQIAIGHFFRGHAPFIKTSWVRTVPFPAFAHLLACAATLFGDIPTEKGNDDGAILGRFVTNGRLSPTQQDVKWETVQEIMQKYKFAPFCPKVVQCPSPMMISTLPTIQDPLMAQFPIAWSIEPRILTLAVSNGFVVDEKYRDLVFRKIFEKRTPSTRGATHTEEILKHVRELPALHPRMFLSRTVAAEVCMEIKSNQPAYNALVKLHEAGDLLFDLPTLITTLMKSFATTRSVMSKATGSALRALQRNFPTKDPIARLAVLITLFNGTKQRTPAATREKIAGLQLKPLTREDLLDLLRSPFVQDPSHVLLYARVVIKMRDEDQMSLLTNAAHQCIVSPYKGKTLQWMVETYPGIDKSLRRFVTESYALDADAIPIESNGRPFRAALCRQSVVRASMYDPKHTPSGAQTVHSLFDSTNTQVGDVEEVTPEPTDKCEDHLGHIGQDPLSAMIKVDESGLARSRYRRYIYYSALSPNRLCGYPEDATPVAAWVRITYGARSIVTATFLTHAVVNGNESIIDTYVRNSVDPAMRVPITLKHFRLLAKLGNAPSWAIWAALEDGAEFFETEAEYAIDLEADTSTILPITAGVKPEPPTTPTRLGPSPFSSPLSTPPGSPLSVASSTSHKMSLSVPGSLGRPRRSTAHRVTSYAVPDIDDIEMEDEDRIYKQEDEGDRKFTPEPEETHMDLWIRHLLAIQQEEQRKHNAKRQQVKQVNPKEKVVKNDFFRSLFVNLRELQRRNDRRRLATHGAPSSTSRPRSKRRAVGSDDERDDDYRASTSGKRRRVSA